MAEPVTLEELKKWSRVDFDEDDALLTSLGIGAREYVEQATGRDYSSDTATVPERAKMAIKALVAHFYEFREPVVIGNPSEVPSHVSRLIRQLRGGMIEPAEETAA